MSRRHGFNGIQAVWLMVFLLGISSPTWAVDATGAPTSTAPPRTSEVERDVTGAPIPAQPQRATASAPPSTPAPVSTPSLSRSSGSLLSQPLPQSNAPQPVQHSQLLPEILLLAEDMTQANEQMRELGALGFRIRQRQLLGQLGWVLSRFQIPRDSTPQAAEQLLQAQFPQWQIEAEQRYELQSADRKHYGQRMTGLAHPECRPTQIPIAMLDSMVAAELFNSDDALHLFDVTQLNPPADFHGTSVASLFLGQPGVPPLLPRAQLYAINVFATDDQHKRYSKTFWLAQGLDLALSQQPAPVVVNFSLGGGYSAILEKAIATTRTRALIVAASGNGGTDAAPSYPAAFTGVIAVAAVDASGRPHVMAQQGDYIDVMAPGVDIWTRDQQGEGYYASGSSFAAPFVSAIVALEAFRNPQAINDLQWQDRFLSQHAQDLGAPGKDARFGWGRLFINDCEKN